MTQPPFKHVRHEVDQGILVLTVLAEAVQGEEIAAALREEMLAALEVHPAVPVLVDFRQTRYVSSVAFWPLLSVYRRLQQPGRTLTVCGLSPTVGDIFHTTRLVSPHGAFAAPFGLEPDRETAVARLAGRGGRGQGPPQTPL